MVEGTAPSSDWSKAEAAGYKLSAGWEPSWFEVGAIKFAAFGDRLLISEDEFKSGYECRTCNGDGKIECPACRGAGSRPRKRGDEIVEVKCSDCEGAKRITCPECNGKGGILVVPDVSQRRPSTGQVVSVGDRVKYFKVGDNVLYSNFAGHAMDLERAGSKLVVRILHESEILASVQGHLELRNVQNQRESLGI
jgi:co-chaperonin GroES (HSP10)